MKIILKVTSWLLLITNFILLLDYVETGMIFASGVLIYILLWAYGSIQKIHVVWVLVYAVFSVLVNILISLSDSLGILDVIAWSIIAYTVYQLNNTDPKKKDEE